MNLAENLAASVARDAGATAFRLDDATLSFEAFDDATARVAGLLASRGIGPGDRVGVMLPNVPAFPIAYYGVLRLGGVVVPMNVLLKSRETGFYLSNPGAKAVFAWHEFADAARAGAADAGAETIVVAPGDFERELAQAQPRTEIASRDEGDTAVILYTSGTTGQPKGAELTHANLAKNAEVSQGLFSITPQDVLLGALPLFHSFGQTCGMNVAVRAGATLSLIPRFEPGKALEILARDRITVFEGVPTMYGALLNHPDREQTDTRSLRLCVSGGASLPIELLHAFEAAFGCAILEGYGLSETSPVACFNQLDPGRRPGSIGTPIAGVEMKLLEVNDQGVGEIAIRGHNVMKGYWDNAEATAAAIDGDGWFRSGDLARVDEDGFYYIVDRKKELIIRGGYNVYPREVEEVLYEHPAVAEAAVIGIPHDELGEEVAAVVALKPGTSATTDELREFVKEQVAAYKYPRQVRIVDALPKTATGKILKREISIPDRAAAS